MSETITGEQAKIIELEVAMANLAQYEKERDYFKQENERLKEENRNLKNELEVYKYKEAERRQKQIQKQKETEEAQKFQVDIMFITVVEIMICVTVLLGWTVYPDILQSGMLKLYGFDFVIVTLYVVYMIRRKKKK